MSNWTIERDEKGVPYRMGWSSRKPSAFDKRCLCGHDLGAHGLGLDLSLICCVCECKAFQQATLPPAPPEDQVDA